MMTYNPGLLISGVSQPQIHKLYREEAHKIQTPAIPANLTMTGRVGALKLTPRIILARRIYDLHNFYGSMNHTPKWSQERETFWFEMKKYKHD